MQTSTVANKRYMRQYARVVVHDDSDVFIVGIETILADHRHFRVMGSARYLDELLAQVQFHRPHIVLLNEWFPETDIRTVIDLVRRAASKDCRILIVGSLNDGYLIRDLLNFGASGYLSRSDDLQNLLTRAFYSVMKGVPYLSVTANAEYIAARGDGTRKSSFYELDEEMRKILRLLANGQYPRAIAHELGIPGKRVYRIRAELRKRFGAKTNEELIRKVLMGGVIFRRGYDG